MYKLTNQPGKHFTLQVVLYKQNSTVPIYLIYDKFKIHSESNGYMLDNSLGNFRYSDKNGYISDYFYEGKKFSTTDRNNNRGSFYSSWSTASYSYQNCVNLPAMKVSGGGWWFLSYPSCYSWYDCNRLSKSYSCGYSNLNAKVPYYSSISGSPTNITRVQMKIRPTDVKNYY